jgi:hypothetical protein
VKVIHENLWNLRKNFQHLLKGVLGANAEMIIGFIFPGGIIKMIMVFKKALG